MRDDPGGGGERSAWSAGLPAAASAGALAAAVVVASALSGCSPRIVGRYADAWCVGEGRAQADRCTDTVAGARVSVVLAPPAEGPPQGAGAAMPERALAAYIAALSDRRMSASAEELRANLAADIAGRQGPSA